jgi:hypothetical protein
MRSPLSNRKPGGPFFQHGTAQFKTKMAALLGGL